MYAGKSQAPVFDVFEAFINTDNIQVFANAATDYIMCLMKFVKGLGELVFWTILNICIVVFIHHYISLYNYANYFFWEPLKCKKKGSIEVRLSLYNQWYLPCDSL